MHDPNGRTARAIGAAVARFPDTEEVTGSIPVSPTGIPAGQSTFDGNRTGLVPTTCPTARPVALRVPTGEQCRPPTQDPTTAQPITGIQVLLDQLVADGLVVDGLTITEQGDDVWLLTATGGGAIRPPARARPRANGERERGRGVGSADDRRVLHH